MSVKLGGAPSPKRDTIQQLKLPTVSELATSVAEANAALSYQLKRIANLEAELKTVTAERDSALSTRDQERLAAQSTISEFETQVLAHIAPLDLEGWGSRFLPTLPPPPRVRDAFR